jgi:hypothetical protein
MGPKKPGKKSKPSPRAARSAVAQARSGGRRSGWLWIVAGIGVCAAILGW